MDAEPRRQPDLEPGMEPGRQPDMQPDMEPDLDGFLLARIAEDRHVAVDAAQNGRGEQWRATDPPAAASGHPRTAEHVARHDPGRVLAECAAKRRIVLACRDTGPDLHFLGRRPHGLPDFPLSPSDRHEFAAVVLALLALPYADHPDYRSEWRP